MKATTRMASRTRSQLASEAPRPPTIHDLARESGVSKTTVSRVLNGSPRVSAEARSSVLAAIDRTGFRINLAARSLRTTRSSLVGLLVPAINNEIIGEIAQHLDVRLREHGVGLSITSSGLNPEGDLVGIDSFEARGVDAIIVLLADDRDPRVRERLQRATCPVVLLDREVRGLRSDAVLTDHRSGAIDAIEHLTQIGHHRVGFSTMTRRTRVGREMLAGFEHGLARSGLDGDDALVIESDDFGHAAGMAAADQLIDARATAIIATGPMTFIGGMLERIEQRGLVVPDDISLIAYTDNELPLLTRPQLTVISRPLEETGIVLSRIVLERLTNGDLPARIEVLRPRLVVRASTGPLGAR
jgi:LacI family transcriptional regulator